MRRRRGGAALLVLVLSALVALAVPAAGQETIPTTVPGATTAPRSAGPTGSSPELLEVPAAPPASDPNTGPRLATEVDEEGAPTFLIVGVVASAIATALILVFFLRSRRSSP